MNILKKALMIMCVAIAAISLVACGEEKDTSKETTIGYNLYSIFLDEIKSSNDINGVAEKLIQDSSFGDIAMGTMNVEEGYLNGFSNEIKGFDSGVMFSPMIGTIPFVGYIFETDTPEELAKTLEESHQLNWNICTTADEMIVKTEGNYVFFVMAPSSFEE